MNRAQVSGVKNLNGVVAHPSSHVRAIGGVVNGPYEVAGVEGADDGPRAGVPYPDEAVFGARYDEFAAGGIVNGIIRIAGTCGELVLEIWIVYRPSVRDIRGPIAVPVWTS